MSDMDPEAKAEMVRRAMEFEVSRPRVTYDMPPLSAIEALAEDMRKQASGQIEPEHSMMFLAARYLDTLIGVEPKPHPSDIKNQMRNPHLTVVGK